MQCCSSDRSSCNCAAGVTREDRFQFAPQLADGALEVCAVAGVLVKAARYRHGRGFAKNLLKIWPAQWTFDAIDGVTPTNNHAERGPRGAVIYRKLSLGSQSRTVRTPHRTSRGFPGLSGLSRKLCPCRSRVSRGVGDEAGVPVDDHVGDQTSAVHVALPLLGVAGVDAAAVAEAGERCSARWRSRPCGAVRARGRGGRGRRPSRRRSSCARGARTRAAPWRGGPGAGRRACESAGRSGRSSRA